MAAAVAAVLALTSELQERQQRKDALTKLNSYELTDERERALAESWHTRLGLPVLAAASDRIRRFTPSGYREKAARKLNAAGMPGEDALDRFITVQVVCGALALPAVFIALHVFSGKIALAVAALAGLLLAFGPSTIVTRKVEDREQDIAKTLPDVLDLLVISVEAGLGFEQAIDRTVASVPGALTDEFARMSGEVRAGARRADALRALAGRIDSEDVRSFVMAVLQADTFGVSIGQMLRNQADEMRVRRRQAAQEKAQKAPVKMLVPMVFCIFPAILVVIIGPAVINMMRTLGG
jgi:tight adherence protein C